MTAVASSVAPAGALSGQLARGALACVVASVAWGAFAFGAVYPWAYWPLVAAALLVAIIGLLVRSGIPRRPLHLGALAAAFALFVTAAALQLVPLSPSTLRALSPAATYVITNLDLAAATDPLRRHALSIWPPATLAGVAVIGSLMLFIVGASRLLSIHGARGVALAIAVIGVCLALTGIIQHAVVTNGKVYGFWTPRMAGNPYGPFVNKNHFGGWMLMALPVAFGLICGAVDRGMEGVRPTLRDRLLWFASPDASRLLLLSGAALVMAVSLFLTMSRSAAGAFGLSIAMTAIVIFKKQSGMARRLGALAMVLALAGAAFAWSGPDVIVSHFADPDWQDVNLRKGAWMDAIDIARRYPLAGTGLNTYGYATLFYQTFDLRHHYAQAHNDYLQLAAEGGALLVVPALLCLAVFILTVRRRFAEETSVTTYWLRTGAVTGIAAVALQEMVEFSLQMPGNAFLFAVLCAVALHCTPEKRRGAVRPS